MNPCSCKQAKKWLCKQQEGEREQLSDKKGINSILTCAVHHPCKHWLASTSGMQNRNNKQPVWGNAQAERAGEKQELTYAMWVQPLARGWLEKKQSTGVKNKKKQVGKKQGEATISMCDVCWPEGGRERINLCKRRKNTIVQAAMAGNNQLAMHASRRRGKDAKGRKN